MNSQEKQKYILLSKIAKEKKYAQEYLSLLARRGDLGSIRIGKRWYTTEQWMNEFIEETARRKEEIASPAKILQPEIINAPIKELIEKIEVPLETEVPIMTTVMEKEEMVLDLEEDVLKIKESFFGRELASVNRESFQQQKEGVQNHQPGELASSPVSGEAKAEVKKEAILPIVEKSVPREEKILKFVAPTQTYTKVRYEKQLVPNIVRKPVREEIIDLRKMVSTDRNNISVRQTQRNEPVEKMQQVFPALAVQEEIKPFSFSNQYFNNEDKREYEARKDALSFSPNFNLQEAADAVWQSLFSKLAISFVTLLLLLVLSGGLIFQKDLREIAGNESGQVAGASDSRASSARADAQYSPSSIANGNEVSGVPLIKSAVHDYIDGTNDRIRENISLSRVILESAVRKDQTQ
jgi:hypothetical protein